MNTQEQQDKAKETVRQVIEQREEIMRAFIAKYECGPEELMQVMQRTEDGSVKYCVRRRTEDEESLGTVMGYLDKAIADCGASLRKAMITNHKTQAVIMKIRGACFREIRNQLKSRMKKNEKIPLGMALEKPADSQVGLSAAQPNSQGGLS